MDQFDLSIFFGWRVGVKSPERGNEVITEREGRVSRPDLPKGMGNVEGVGDNNASKNVIAPNNCCGVRKFCVLLDCF